MNPKFRKSNNEQRSLGASATKLLTGLFLSLVILSASMARAEDATPPHAIEFPEGWHAVNLNSAVFPDVGSIICVGALNDPKLW
jgi:hypothetical protein